MGCDIHIVLERKEPDTEWVGIWSSDRYPGQRLGRPRIARRDYGFFAEVAHVRGGSETGSYPAGLPRDVSRLAWLEYQTSPTDHHSQSWMTAPDFVAAWLRVNGGGSDAGVRPEFAASDLLGVDADWPEACEYRVVFWFDN